MPDDISRMKDMLIASGARQVQAGLAALGIPAGRAAVNGGEGLGGNATIEITDSFSTGYSGGLTVVPFLLDYSLLDSTDVLVD